jgi:cell division protein FtsW
MGQSTTVSAGKTSKTRAKRTRKAAQLHVRVDLPLLGIVLTLLAIGLMMLFSASWDFSWHIDKPISYIFLRQLVWLGLGLVTAGVLVFLDYHWVQKFAILILGGTILALIAVLVVSEVRHGAARTLNAGSIQPSELAKLMVILYLGVWLSVKQERLHSISLGLIPMGVLLGAIGALIFLQPDLSATITIFILGGMMFFLAGGETKQIFIVVVVALIAGWLVVWVNPTGSNRMATYIPGLYDPLDASYHVRRAIGAFVNGGWLGTGVNNGIVKLTSLPLPHSDSIFAVIGKRAASRTVAIDRVIAPVFAVRFPMSWRSAASIASSSSPSRCSTRLATVTA